jgi:hypothetical protein
VGGDQRPQHARGAGKDDIDAEGDRRSCRTFDDRGRGVVAAHGIHRDPDGPVVGTWREFSGHGVIQAAVSGCYRLDRKMPHGVKLLTRGKMLAFMARFSHPREPEPPVVA